MGFLKGVWVESVFILIPTWPISYIFDPLALGSCLYQNQKNIYPSHSDRMLFYPLSFASLVLYRTLWLCPFLLLMLSC